MKPIKILIVDDEMDLASQLSELLHSDGFQSFFITNPEFAETKLNELDPDVLIIDRKMPQKNGLDVVKDLRASSSHEALPIIMLTACNTQRDLIDCFESGVDDFISKPFKYEELKVRIKALYNRSNKNPKRLLRFHNIYMDTVSQTVYIGDEKINLTLTEYKLLKILLTNPNEAIDREVLCEETLGGKNVTKRTVDVHMTSLRKKLLESARLLHTVRGVGYKLSA